MISIDTRVIVSLGPFLKKHSISILTELQSDFPSQGRVEHCQPEDGEREGGGQKEGGRERQTFIKKSSPDQHFTRYEQQLLFP